MGDTFFEVTGFDPLQVNGTTTGGGGGGTPAATISTLVFSEDGHLRLTLSDNSVFDTDIATILTEYFATYKVLARNPELLVTGSPLRDSSNNVTSCLVTWPDGVTGTFTVLSRDANGAVLSYSITHEGATTTTYTQPGITRDAAGTATDIPDIVVS